MNAFKRADHLIAVSHWIKRNLLKLGMPDKKVSVIYNPIDTSLFSPERKLEKRSKEFLDELDLEPSSYYFAVGSLVSRKRYIDLIRAFGSYNGEKKLVIVGDGPELSNVCRLIRKHDLSNRVRIFRRVSACSLPYLYASAYAFVTCSMAEGFPVAVMEAMSSGLGIISPDSPWIEELVGQSNGVLFPPLQVEATTNALSFFDDEGSSKRYGLASRYIAEKNFSVKTCATQTLRVYGTALDQRVNMQPTACPSVGHF
jgi:glycosyltransferase involved in cell wall biosynthesis